MDNKIDYDLLVNTPNVIIAIEYIQGYKKGVVEPNLLTVKFVLDCNYPFEIGCPGYILSLDNKQLNKKNMLFGSIDEFFALKSYLTRNGILI